MLEAISRAVQGADAAQAASAARASGTPSNQQILEASKKAYAAHQPAVDASVLAITNLISTGALTKEITALDDFDWGAGEPASDFLGAIFASTDVQGAMHAAEGSGAKSYSVGAFYKALRDGKAGIVGRARSLSGGGSSTVQATIDIYSNLVSTDRGQNLQLGLWTKEPDGLGGRIVGLYINTTFRGISVDLKILLDESLVLSGFMISTGAHLRLPVQTSPFGGQLSVL